MQAAAFVVEPEFQGNGQETNEEVVERWENVLLNLLPDAKEKRVVTQCREGREVYRKGILYGKE